MNIKPLTDRVIVKREDKENLLDCIYYRAKGKRVGLLLLMGLATLERFCIKNRGRESCWPRL